MIIGALVSPVLGLLTRDREEPMPGAEPPLVENPERWEEFYRELSRARRHERTFAIVRIPLLHGDAPVSASTSSDGDGASDGDLVAERLRESVRLTDRVWVDGGNAFVLMPEADRREAVAAIPRAADGEAISPEAVSIASFPEDGVTSGAVLAALMRPDEAKAAVTDIADAKPNEAEPIAAQRKAG